MRHLPTPKCLQQAQEVRAAGELLQLPQGVISTALTFLHRFYKTCPTAAEEAKVFSEQRPPL